MSNTTVLVELTRGSLVESVHRGAIAILGADGSEVLSLGDIARPVYPRSAFKALQALPLVESGAAEAFSLSNAEIALACASHSGEAAHVATVRDLLMRLGLDERALACGAHAPSGEQAARDLLLSGARPSRLHNNCSGKHAGMLVLARHLGVPVEGYEHPDHPVQQRIRETISQMAGVALTPDGCGIDGCSAPNWAMPLRSLAHAFARFSVQAEMDDTRTAACCRILSACFEEPGMVAGTGRLCTSIMYRLKGRAFVKTGAEGVYAAMFPEHGLGVALKIDDGAKRAAEFVIRDLCAAVLPDEADKLADLISRDIYNWRGEPVGRIRLSEDAAAALEKLRTRMSAA
ncbi:MAG: asparaginase [Pseudomonadota bacterium]|nr:asparaginase [Pseudomonadota bacterium]